MEEYYKKENNKSDGMDSWVDPKMKNLVKQESNKINPPDFAKILKGKASFK